MAGYAGFQRSRRVSRSRGGMRRRGGTGRRVGYKKGRVSLRPRFATVGFARNVEKKYFDKTYQSNPGTALTGQESPAKTNNGVMWISADWGNYTFGTKQTLATSVSNDMLKGVETGTTARTRIGNKIGVNYLKGAFTFTAATGVQGEQGGEEMGQFSGDGVGTNYLRTTYRFVIVKDMQVNSTDTNVTWAQVFDTSNMQAGVHSELNVDNMGRFVVLEDKFFTVDADSPQKTLPFKVSGSRVGSVRYNGPSGNALTDKGIYVVWAAFTMGVLGGNSSILGMMTLPSPVGHARLCFNDD